MVPWLAIVASCAKRPPPPPPDAPTQDITSAHMHEHWRAAEEAREAVIDGDLERVRAAAAALVARHPEGHALPPSWTGPARDIDRLGAALAGAASLKDAAAAVAALGRACGGCHAEVGRSADVAPPSEPAPGPETAAHMQRHRWAADRMWEGLVAPSDELWSRGAAALKDDPTVIAHTGYDDETVHELGAWMSATGEADDKMAVYSIFLAACATCHEAVRNGAAP
jgi:cytochrome c556